MLSRYENTEDKYRKVLYGNDTDVSDCMITRVSANLYLILTIHFDEEKEAIYPNTYTWSKEQFKKHFDLQYGAPMMYLSKEDYEWITTEWLTN